MEDLKEANLVEPTHSYWAAPSKLVKKKDRTFRLVVDYRGLNKQIKKLSRPLPRITNVIDSLEGKVYFSNIDFPNGLRGGITKLGFFRHSYGFVKMEENTTGFNLSARSVPKSDGNSPGGLSYELALIHLDDILIFGKSFDEHLSLLELVLCRIKESGLKIKGSKCHLFQKRIHF